MNDIFSLSAKIRNLKCFSEVAQGFDKIKPMNLIIGRNNSGKSTLLDLIWALTQKKFEFVSIQYHRGQQPEIIIESPFTEEEVRAVFRENTSGGTIPGNHWRYGQKYVGSNFKWRYNSPSKRQFIDIDEPQSLSIPIKQLPDASEYLNKLANAKKNPFENRNFKRINAERDIVPELDQPTDLTVKGNGQGTTNIIQNFINKVGLPSEIVESTLLKEINDIFGSDANFTDIVCQQRPDLFWEVYLEEETKGRISLSQSGSGLKTIILILVFLYLVPEVEKKSLGDYVFAFEELENNLHPTLIRRLHEYLYTKFKSSGCLFFLTTHSNVAIDQFSKNKDAQIIHVTHDGQTALCRTVLTYVENKGVLDDLDVRASDLLQANGVIWVEGPSDRIYFNRWIELWSDGTLKEGTHYQCIFYGGRLLAHLTAKEPSDDVDVIAIFNVNRNAIILMDSDKRAKQTPVNATKQRLIEEIQKQNGIAWLTKGREIENYIPSFAVGKLLNIDTPEQVGQYDDFFDYLDKLGNDEGKNYRTKKPLMAEKISPYLRKVDLETVLDLGECLKQVCQRIKEWNA
ncbi:MAG: ATP-binding protein [Deltaproteobacteria bacterium]